jgi:hypothetical protein
MVAALVEPRAAWGRYREAIDRAERWSPSTADERGQDLPYA